MKLGGNFLITAMIASLSEGFVFAKAMGVEPAVFLETVNQALFQSPFYEMYGKIMLIRPQRPARRWLWAKRICVCSARPRRVDR